MISQQLAVTDPYRLLTTLAECGCLPTNKRTFAPNYCTTHEPDPACVSLRCETLETGTATVISGVTVGSANHRSACGTC